MDEGRGVCSPFLILKGKMILSSGGSPRKFQRKKFYNFKLTIKRKEKKIGKKTQKRKIFTAVHGLLFADITTLCN